MAVLLTVGVGTGFGASAIYARQPVAGGVPAPVAAASPSLPVDPAPEYAEDPDVPPLTEDLEMTPGRLGAPPFEHVFPVPAGWEATANGANETKWKDPANPPAWTYLLRVEQVGSDNTTVARTLERRVEELDDVEDRFEVISRTADTVTFSYTDQDHLRVGILRWLQQPGGPFADLEIAVTGRDEDLPGMQALVERVSAGVSRG